MKPITLFLLMVTYITASAQQFDFNFEDDDEFDIVEIEFLDTVDGNNIWQIGSPNKTTFNSAYNGQNAIITDTLYSYPVNTHSSFIFKFSIEDTDLLYIFTLHFEHKYETIKNSDGGFIEVSYDYGKSWINIAEDTTGSEYPEPCIIMGCVDRFFYNGYSTTDTLPDGTPAFSGSTLDWTTCNYTRGFYADDLVNDSIFVKFSFQSDSIADELDGWIIDNLTILLDYGPVNVPEYPYEQHHFIYPNPVEENSVMEFSNYESVISVEIYTLKGNSIFSEKNIKSSIELGKLNLPPGFYITKVNYNNQIETSRFLIKH